MIGKRRRTFRTHIILVTEGRLFLFLMLLIWPMMLFGTVITLIKGTDHPFLWVVALVIFISVTIGLFAVVLPFFWPRCFGKLIVTDKTITWRCLFMKSRRIELSDIRYSDIRAFTEGNVVKCDFYHTGFLYILLSKKSIPQMRVDKYRCTDDLIIFMFSRKLCECLAEVLPEPTNLIFQARLPAFRRADRQKENRKINRAKKRAKERAKKKLTKD